MLYFAVTHCLTRLAVKYIGNSHAVPIARCKVGIVNSTKGMPAAAWLLAKYSQFEEKLASVLVIAGNSLFHYVVETDLVALRCTKLLQEAKAGRVTFMPLNQLRPPQVAHNQFQLCSR
jgi:chromosome segregation ATPase